MFQNKTVLVTGGTGSFGKRFINFFIDKKIKVKKLIILSRDELKQSEMREKYSTKKYKFLRYFIGDIRDKERLRFAFRDVDIIVHAAALKQVPSAEYNPTEYIKTNIIGAQNIIECALESNKVSRVLALSTDKAVLPINLYGATKLCSDKLFISANRIKGSRDLRFGVLRYGNVMMSRGSVIPIFLSSKKKYFTVTDKEMTRFSLTLDDSVNAAFYAIRNIKGGEIIIPKAKSYKITDLAHSIDNKKKIKIVGIRPGEKLHEVLICKSDAQFTYENKEYYIIKENLKDKNKLKGFKKVKKDFQYSSNLNKFLTKKELKKIISNQLQKND